MGALASMIVAAIGMLGLRGSSACLAASGLGILLMATWTSRRIGGFTGDTLGATSEVVEAAVLLAVCACGDLAAHGA